MDFSTIGSISQYTKTTALKAQWNLKKKNGDMTGHSKSLDDFLSAGGLAPQTQEEADNEKLQKITNKVNAGAKLTEDEMEYLKAKNPQLYGKLRQIEKEQKAYEEALRHCKSKDEAQRLHMARVGEAMQAAKNGDATAAYRMNRMSESMTALTETDEYKKLSTEAEQALERKEQRETEQGLETEVSENREKEPKQAESPEETLRGADTQPMETDVAAADEARAEDPAESDAPETPSEHAAVTPHFGTHAYVSQQTVEAQENKQRKAIDVDA